MFKTRMVLLAGITLSTLMPPLLAKAVPKPCTKQQAMQAEADTDHLTNWNAVYQSFTRFSQCDDGAIAEGYSDAVGKLLADNWKQFPDLVKLASSDQRFQTFVVHHIDETVPADTLKKAAQNAKSRCPASAAGLCKLIARAASH
jgi:hypothetical protein